MAKNIEKREIPEIAFELGVVQHSEGILMLRNDIHDIKNILNKPFRATHNSLMIIQKGKVSIRVNMFDYRLTENAILVVSPSAIKEFVDFDEGSILYSVLFTNEYIFNSALHQSYLDIFNIFITNSHYFINTNSEIFEEISHFLTVLDKKFISPLKNDSKVPNLLFLTLLMLIAEIIQNQDVNFPKETKNRKGDLIIRFFQLLPQHIRQHRDVQFYADTLQVNAKYLSQTLKERTQKTALILISEMVILEARVLLSNPQLSISQVAEELGFSDQFTFSKYFKLHTSITPSNYRVQNTI